MDTDRVPTETDPSRLVALPAEAEFARDLNGTPVTAMEMDALLREDVALNLDSEDLAREKSRLIDGERLPSLLDQFGALLSDPNNGLTIDACREAVRQTARLIADSVRTRTETRDALHAWELAGLRDHHDLGLLTALFAFRRHPNGPQDLLELAPTAEDRLFDVWWPTGSSEHDAARLHFRVQVKGTCGQLDDEDPIVDTLDRMAFERLERHIGRPIDIHVRQGRPVLVEHGGALVACQISFAGHRTSLTNDDPRHIADLCLAAEMDGRSGVEEFDLEERLRRALARYPTNAPGPADATQTFDYEFRRDGDLWRVAFNGELKLLQHRKGFLTIQMLLRYPNEWISASDLDALRIERPAARAEKPREAAFAVELSSASAPAEATYDKRYKRHVVDECRRLLEERDRAKRDNDEAKQTEFQAELDKITPFLEESAHNPLLAPELKKQREAVRMNRRNAVAALAEQFGEPHALIRHLKEAIKSQNGRTGYFAREQFDWQTS
jgi:hypothetical protein